MGRWLWRRRCGGDLFARGSRCFGLGGKCRSIAVGKGELVVGIWQGVGGGARRGGCLLGCDGDVGGCGLRGWVSVGVLVCGGGWGWEGWGVLSARMEEISESRSSVSIFLV